jgi:hypothetical protein
LRDALLPDGAARVPLPQYYVAAPPARQARLSGLTMLALGGIAFAVAHYANAELPPALQSMVDAARTLLVSALALFS